MSKKTFPALAAFLAAALVLALAGAAVLFLGMKGSFDTGIRHFGRGAVAPLLLTVAMLLSLLAAAAAGFVSGKDPLKEDALRVTPFVTFAAVLTALLLVVSCVFDFRDASAVAATASFTTKGAYVAILRIRGVLALLSAPYAVLSSLPSAAGRKTLLGGCLFPVLLWTLTVTLSCYFDGRLAINDPVKILSLLLGICLMLTAVAEGRVLFARGKAGFPVFLLLTAVGVGGAVSIPSLILAFTDAGLFGLSVANASLYVALWLFAAARALSLCAGRPADGKIESKEVSHGNKA